MTDLPRDLTRDEIAGRLSRRDFLKRAGALGLSASAIGAFLSACGASATATAIAPTVGAAATTAATNVPAGAASTAGAAATAVATNVPGGIGATVAAAATNPAGAATAAATAASGAAPTVAAAATGAAGGTGVAVSRSGFKGTLQYWVLGYTPGGGGLGSRLMDSAVAGFTKANPDIKVEITGYPGNNEGFTKLTQAVQGGGSVDIFRLPSDILPALVKDGLVAPIDEFLTNEDRADIFPPLLDAVKVDGKSYAWPLWVPPVAMYLNLDIFQERGVAPPTGPWTYEQFVDTAKKLTFTRANGEQVYGYTGGIDPGLVNTWPFIIGDGALPLSTDNTKYTWNTPDAYSGLKKLVDLAQVHKVTPPDFGSQAIADIATSFKDRKVVAMYSEPSGASSGYRDAKLNFEIAPMPIGKSGKLRTAGGIGLISVAQGRDRAKLQASMDLGRYLTSAQVAQDVDGYYLAPGARKSVKTKDPINKFDPYVEPCYITPIIAEWPQIRTILHPNIQNAVLGKISPEQAFNAPAAEIDGILAGRRR